MWIVYPCAVNLGFSGKLQYVLPTQVSTSPSHAAVHDLPAPLLYPPSWSGRCSHSRYTTTPLLPMVARLLSMPSVRASIYTTEVARILFRRSPCSTATRRRQREVDSKWRPFRRLGRKLRLHRLPTHFGVSSPLAGAVRLSDPAQGVSSGLGRQAMGCDRHRGE